MTEDEAMELQKGDKVQIVVSPNIYGHMYRFGDIDEVVRKGEERDNGIEISLKRYYVHNMDIQRV